MKFIVLFSIVLFLGTVQCISEQTIDKVAARLCVDAYNQENNLPSYAYAQHVKRYSQGTMVANTYVDTTNKLFYVAIRGTEPTLSDWKNNAKFRQEALKFYTVAVQKHLGYVHRGFAAKAELIADSIEREFASNFGEYKIVVTGHSQGGANAYIVALHFALGLKKNDIQVVTFGAPRVGDKEFAATMQKYVPTMRRYVGKDWRLGVFDYVTLVPTTTPFVYTYVHPCKGTVITSVKSGPLSVHSMPNYELALNQYFQRASLANAEYAQDELLY